jgi:ubiquinone/menaquinone biosynthesis C-methylase UbiE
LKTLVKSSLGGDGSSMSSGRSNKELAYLYDLYVAPDWGERFAELIDEHVQLPKEGRALYLVSGTGSHALLLQERAGEKLSFICIDESQERLDLAHAKAAATKKASQIEFHAMQLETLDFKDDQFDLVIGDASLIAAERLPEILGEMVRVAKSGAVVALNITSASSFGEFFSIYWEALCNTDLEEHASIVEDLIKAQPTVSDLEILAAESGLNLVKSWTRKEEFDFSSGEEFFSSPLITEFLLKEWFYSLPDEEARDRVSKEINRIIDEERQDMDFDFSVKATIVVGQKAV